MNFKDIKGYEGLYQVSSCGTVKGLDRIGFDGRKIKSKIIKGRPDKDKYLTVVLRKDGRGFQKKVHRLVCSAFLGDSDLQVNHKNRNKQDNNVENLEWVTPKENSRHAHNRIDKVICPKGHVYTINGIASFCEDHGLTKQLLGKVLLGKRNHHKGWRIYEQNTENVR